MEVSGRNLTFFHNKGSNNILPNTISRLKMLDINKDSLENAKRAAVKDKEECIVEVVATRNKPEVMVDFMLNRRRTLFVEN